MKCALALAALVFAGCVTEVIDNSGQGRGRPIGPKPKSSDELAAEASAAEGWIAWRDATVAGDARMHFEGLTANLVSHWLWGRLEDGKDPNIGRWLSVLGPEQRKELDLWRDFNNRTRAERAEVLPKSILATPWLFRTYEAYFNEGLNDLKRTLEMAQVKSVAIEGPWATVVTTVNGQLSERYVMVFVDGRWRVDGYIPPTPTARQ